MRVLVFCRWELTVSSSSLVLFSDSSVIIDGFESLRCLFAGGGFSDMGASKKGNRTAEKYSL
jgi:hypothetical protein